MFVAFHYEQDDQVLIKTRKIWKLLKQRTMSVAEINKLKNNSVVKPPKQGSFPLDHFAECKYLRNVNDLIALDKN